MERPLQEKFLLYRVRAKRDPDAFGKIYDLYARRIYRFVFFKVSSEEEAQDLTADVFLKAWQYLLEESGRDVRHLGALLYSIARNRVIDHYRSRSLKETLPLTEDADEIIADDRSLADQTEAKLDVEMLERHLRSLKDEYREVLIMRYLDELSAAEIGKILQKPPGTVRVLLHRALAAIKHHVAKDRGTTEEPS